MKIGVTSQNSLKLDAVRKVYSSLSSVEIIGYSTDSKVGEQPIDDETLLGARNRISDLKSRADDLDRMVSIENGIFYEGGKWHDKAVVIIYDARADSEHIAYSDEVMFPTQYVDQARQIGFDKITVGKVMMDARYVHDHKDPHLSISGKSRKEYLEETIRKLVKEVEHN